MSQALTLLDTVLLSVIMQHHEKIICRICVIIYYNNGICWWVQNTKDKIRFPST